MTPEINHSPSPNWDERPEGCTIDAVIIHYTGMESGEAALDRLCDPDAKVSAHYLIEEDGRLFQMVPEDKRAWHAGVSHWAGRDNLNHTSIGIELVNPGHEFGYRDFSKAQIDTLLAMLKGIASRHSILPSRYLGHSDIAPDRKTDPGERFPWERLAREGFGVWSGVDGRDASPIAQKGDKGPIINKLNKQLGIVGYHVSDTDCFDCSTEYVIRAFQAHWRPETVSGIFDAGTAARLEDITNQMRNTGERL
ncbi:MAG: N-acetylmuramoyl-L-alanine amidase [Alphaproteobacteria bacterium]|nr:N-acetylmuramoyl-L-alanine amidase [Alphaproteobacteria bacterium]